MTSCSVSPATTGWKGKAATIVLNGGAGDDFIIGGSGYDIASYADEFAGVLVDLNVGRNSEHRRLRQ